MKKKRIEDFEMPIDAGLFGLDPGWSAEVLEDDLDDRNDVESDEDSSLSKNPWLADWPDHKLKKLETQQTEADEVNRINRVETRRARRDRGKTHRRLRIVGGSRAGVRLYSPRGKGVRPMMERVRAAIFDMVLAQCGGSNKMPKGSRWLDLFAGTGSVGLEAVSRGCQEAHFVEMNPWVVSNCLQPNSQLCGAESQARIHVMKAEEFLKRSMQPRQFPQQAYDFISVCPPYLEVSYPELQDLLAASGLISHKTFVFMEYPRQLKHEVRETMGPLVMLKNREYGRTYLAVYGPA